MGRWYRRQPVAWRRIGYPRRSRWTARWGPPALQLLGNTQPQRPAVGLRRGAGEPSTGTTRVREALHRAWRESRHAVSSNPYALYPPSVLPSKGRTASLPFITRPRMLGRAGATRPAPGLATPGMGLGMGGAACRVSASAPSNARPHTGHALWRMSVERLLLLGLAPWLPGPWDPGAPSPDISRRCCLYADTPCSIWFSRRSLAPGCGRTCPSLGKHRGHSATDVMLKLIFIMLLRGPAVKSSGGPSLPARPGIPA